MIMTIARKSINMYDWELVFLIGPEQRYHSKVFVATTGNEEIKLWLLTKVYSSGECEDLYSSSLSGFHRVSFDKYIVNDWSENLRNE